MVRGEPRHFAERDAGRPIRRPRELLSRGAVAARPRACAGSAAIASRGESSRRTRKLLLHDNEALARYLVTDFVSNLGAFKGVAGLGGLVYRRLDSVAASGDPASTYNETV